MTRRAGSLEVQLIGRLTAILAGSFLLFAVTYMAFISDDAHFHAYEAVGEQAQDLGAALIVSRGRAQFDRKTVSRLLPPGARFAARVASPGGPAVGGSDPALLAVMGATAAGSGRTRATTARTIGGLEVIAIERVTKDGTGFEIAVQEWMSIRQLELLGLGHEFGEEILPSFLPALLLAIAVTWFTIRRSLRPLRSASAEASAISIDRPGQRMSSDRMASEIRPLIHAVNRGLERLENALGAERRFTANAAHELRTPLAVLRARVDGLPMGDVRRMLVHDIDRMSRALSQMLLSARLGARLAGEEDSVDLVAIARDVIADLAPLAHRAGRDIALCAAGRPALRGSAVGIESAVRNLVENALRFTPDGGTVMVLVGPTPLIVVDDEGPGVADADKPHVFEPFWRGSGAQGSGAGLGLSIVRQVAELHAGRATVEDSARGGARFVLVFGATDTREEHGAR